MITYGQQEVQPDVLVVCTANVCRSPAVARLLRAELGDGVSVASAGTDPALDWEGCPVAAAWLEDRRIPPVAHAPTALQADDVRSARVILTAGRAHRSRVAELVPSARSRSFTLTQAARLARWCLDGNAAEAPVSGHVQERLMWLAYELDLARGRAPAPAGPEEDDLADPHEGAAHEAVLERLVGAVAVLGQLWRVPIREGAVAPARSAPAAAWSGLLGAGGRER